MRYGQFLYCCLILFSLPVKIQAGTSNSLLDVSPDGTRLLVANTDRGTVTAVDLAARKAIVELPAGDSPEAAAWINNHQGVVAVYGDDVLVFFDIEKKQITHILQVPDEPYGIVTTRDGRRAYVTHDNPGSVSEIDLETKTLLRTLKVGEHCRGIAISHDEKTFYVSEFYTARLLAVDIASGQVVDSWPGYEQDNNARHVQLHPTRPKAYMAHIRSRTTHFDARGSIFPFLSYCDLWSKPEKRRRAAALDTYNGVIVTATPWETALSPDGKKLYILYSGTNDANVSTVYDDDYKESERERLVRLGRLPRAIRAHGNEVYVYNTLDYEVTVHDRNLTLLGTIKVSEPSQTEAWRRGKELFHTAKRPMGGTGWVACASCHQDGLTDGRVWQNPEGNRRTPHLFGLAHTHPLHWSADRDESQDFEYTIRGKLMKGRGLFDGRLKPRPEFQDAAELDEHLAGKSADLDALAVYTNSFPVRPSPHASAGKLSAAAERGKALFFDAKVNCSGCHSGPYYSDSRLEKPFRLHDVGTGRDDREKMGTAFDTPTLLGVYRGGPYLHDGSAKSLRDVLTTANPQDKHGVTSHLKPTEIDDLIEFLKCLPYEPLPDKTPNTVNDFIVLTFPKPRVGDGPVK